MMIRTTVPMPMYMRFLLQDGTCMCRRLSTRLPAWTRVNQKSALRLIAFAAAQARLGTVGLGWPARGISGQAAERPADAEPVPGRRVDDVEIKMVLFLPHEAASVPVTRQVLDGCLATLGVTPDTRADIALALSEACANVIQHARSGDQYEVQVRARNGQCVIEVVNTGTGNGEPAPYRGEDDEGWSGAMALASDPVPATAEHGRGLKIINAVVDNLQLTGNEREGTTVHFEKTLDWLPGAAGQHLSSVDGGEA